MVNRQVRSPKYEQRRYVEMSNRELHATVDVRRRSIQLVTLCCSPWVFLLAVQHHNINGISGTGRMLSSFRITRLTLTIQRLKLYVICTNKAILLL